MLEEIAARVTRGESFAFETTLAGLAFGRAIPRWQAAGYHVKLLFLSLPDAEMAIMRSQHALRKAGTTLPSR